MKLAAIILSALIAGAVAQIPTEGIAVPRGYQLIISNNNGMVTQKLVPIKKDNPVAKLAATPVAAKAPPSLAPENPDAESKPKVDFDVILGKELKGLNFDRPLPAAPAFVALGVTPETVSSPTTPREFASSLINGVDRNGDLQTGLAMEVAPYQIFNGKNVTPARYRDEWWTRVFYNTSLSIGTIKAAEDKKAVKLAVGLSITLWDKGDELMREKSLEILNGVFSQVEVPDYNPFLSEEENKAAQDAWISAAKEMSKSYDKQIAEARKKIWGKSAWNVAWAPTWRSGTGKYDELQYDGSTVWTTYAYGFENLALEGKCQVFAHLRYRDGEEVADPNDATKTATQRSLLAAGRIRWGQPDMNWNVEGGT